MTKEIRIRSNNNLFDTIEKILIAHNFILLLDKNMKRDHFVLFKMEGGRKIQNLLIFHLKGELDLNQHSPE